MNNSRENSGTKKICGKIKHSAEWIMKIGRTVTVIAGKYIFPMKLKREEREPWQTNQIRGILRKFVINED
jgi:hypothetical protein